MAIRNVWCLALLGCGLAQGQLFMEGIRPGGPSRLLPSDAAILEGREPRTELPCEVKPVPPVLGYDLTFHTGYEVTIPLRALVGAGDRLTAILQVTPESANEPFYLAQRWAIPPLEESAKGDAYLHGKFVVGEGNYHVAWLVRDSVEHFCAAFWQVSASRLGKDSLVKLDIAPGMLEPDRREPFRDEQPGPRDTERPLNVLVMLHVAPEAVGGAEISAAETQAMVSILRNIVRERRFTNFSITAFNIDQRAVIYHQGSAPNVDFPALGQAVKELHLGTVAIQRLAEKDGGPQFLVSLLAEELARQRPDVLMFVGPKSAPEEGSLRNSLKLLQDPGCPVFYLNYSADQKTNPWRDLLGSVVKFWKGAEYSISNPRDLFLAWSGVLSRLTSGTAKQDRAAMETQ